MLNACDGIEVRVVRDGDGWQYVIDLGGFRLHDRFDDRDDCYWAGLLRFYALHAELSHRCLWSPTVRAWAAAYGNQPRTWCV